MNIECFTLLVLKDIYDYWTYFLHLSQSLEGMGLIGPDKRCAFREDSGTFQGFQAIWDTISAYCLRRRARFQVGGRVREGSPILIKGK